MLAVRNSSIPGPPLGTLGPLFTFLWGVTPPTPPVVPDLCTSICFKTSEKKTLIGPDKISEDMFPSLYKPWLKLDPCINLPEYKQAYKLLGSLL